MKHIRLLCLALALCLLAACGAPETVSVPPRETLPPSAAPSQTPPAVEPPQTTESPQEQTGWAYRADWSELALDGAMPERLFLLGDKPMLEVSLEDGGKGVWDVERGALLSAGGLPGQALAVAPSGNRLWYCVETENGLTLCAVEDGAVAGTVALSDSKSCYPYAIALDGSGYFYLLDGKSLRAYGISGNLLSNIPMDTEQGVTLTGCSDGQVVLCTRSLATGLCGVKLVNTESIGKNLAGETVEYRSYPGWAGNVLLSDGGCLYALDLAGEEPEMTAVLDWIDTDVDPAGLVTMASGDPETVYVVAGDEGSVRLGALTRIPAEAETRTVLNLGISGGESGLTQAVKTLAVAYNQSQSNVRVHVVDYRIYRDRTLWNDVDKLDLVLASGAVNYGALTDLRTLYDGELGAETLMPCVAAAFDGVDELTRLPLFFAVNTLVGRGSVVGETEGWTPAELLEVVQAHPEAALFRYANAYDGLSTLLTAIDYVRDFAPLLEAARTLPADEGELMTLPVNQSQEVAEPLNSGALLLAGVRIDSFSDLLAWDAALEGDAAFKGYPMDEGNGNGGLLVTLRDQELAIPEASAHKAEAWDFIKAILNDGGVNQYISANGFPILRSAYDDLEREAMGGLTYTDEAGNPVTTGGQVMLQEYFAAVGGPYEVAPLTAAQAEKFRDYLDGVRYLDNRDWQRSLRENWIARAKDAWRAMTEEGLSPQEAAATIPDDYMN